MVIFSTSQHPFSWRKRTPAMRKSLNKYVHLMYGVVARGEITLWGERLRIYFDFPNRSYARSLPHALCGYKRRYHLVCASVCCLFYIEQQEQKKKNRNIINCIRKIIIPMVKFITIHKWVSICDTFSSAVGCIYMRS
jgi:hypothetical protein